MIARTDSHFVGRPHGVVDLFDQAPLVGVDRVFVVHVPQEPVHFVDPVSEEKERVDHVQDFFTGRLQFHEQRLVKIPIDFIGGRVQAKRADNVCHMFRMKVPGAGQQVILDPRFHAEPQVSGHSGGWFEGLALAFTNGQWDEAFPVLAHDPILRAAHQADSGLTDKEVSL